MSEDLEPIRRVEIYFNDDREEVPLEESTWKYVTLFSEEGEIEEQYSVDIINGVDPEKEIDEDETA